MANVQLDTLFAIGDRPSSRGCAVGFSEEQKRVIDIALIQHGVFTVDELARARGVHPRTVYKWADRVDSVDDPLAVELRRLVERGTRRRLAR